MKLHHGGGLRAAAIEYGIAPEQWLDTSAAINPEPWPVPTLPADVWNRLPESNDELADAVHDYYGPHPHLALAGTQAFIETFPRLLTQRRVWVPDIGYQEHAHCWQKHGHQLVRYNTLPDTEALRSGDIVLVINPNNPTGKRYAPDDLLPLITAVANRDGLMIVDEAFMDTTPADSLLETCRATGLPAHLLVLRSFGKFFGLAGVRLGFCFASHNWLAKLDDLQSPWSVNHPARWIATRALRDASWQAKTRQQLAASRDLMLDALQQHTRTTSITSTPLFITLALNGEATRIHQQLASQAILTRLFADEGLLRICVESRPAPRQRLLDALCQALTTLS